MGVRKKKILVPSKASKTQQGTNQLDKESCLFRTGSHLYSTKAASSTGLCSQMKYREEIQKGGPSIHLSTHKTDDPYHLSTIIYTSNETLKLMEVESNAALELIPTNSDISHIVQIRAKKGIDLGIAHISPMISLPNDVICQCKRIVYLPTLHEIVLTVSEENRRVGKCEKKLVCDVSESLRTVKDELMDTVIVPGMVYHCRKEIDFIISTLESFALVSLNTKIRFRLTERPTQEPSVFIFQPIYKKAVSHLLTHINFLSRGSQGGANFQGSGMRICGGSGTGKTTLLSLLTREISCSYFFLNSWPDPSFITAIALFAPILVILDDMDLFFTDDDQQNSDLWYKLRHALEYWRGRGVLFLATTTDNQCGQEMVNPRYFSLDLEVCSLDAQCDRYAFLSHIFENLEIHFLEDNENSRDSAIEKEFSELILDRSSLNIPENKLSPLEDFASEVSQRTQGYTPRDLLHVFQYAKSESLRKSSRLAKEHVMSALRVIRPLSLRSFQVQIPKTTWDDIGGQDETKKKLQTCVRWLTTHSTLLTRFGVRPPRGVLLHGPPGCSKTMLAKALAHEGRMHFLSVKGPELLSKWVGDSEKAIRTVFEKARHVAPSIIFFDEIDGLCGSRGGGGVHDRVVCQLLHEMDGLNNTSTDAERSPKQILVVAATNRPEAIDPALIRPGRFDHKIYVGLPDLTERLHILNLSVKDLPVNSSVNLSELAENMGGYSGAETVALVREAATAALEEDLSTQVLDIRHFRKALVRIGEQRA